MSQNNKSVELDLTTRGELKFFLAMLGVLGLLVLAVLGPPHRTSTAFNLENTVFHGHSLYSNFELVYGTPGGVRGVPVLFGSLWVPTVKHSVVKVSDNWYGDCAGIGETLKKANVWAGEPFDSLACTFIL